LTDFTFVTFVSFCKKNLWWPEPVVQMMPVQTLAADFLDYASSLFRQRLQQLGQERTDP